MTVNEFFLENQEVTKYVLIWLQSYKHTRNVFTVSARGNIVASGSEDGSVMAYNTTVKSKIIHYLHNGPVIGVLLTDRYLISSSYDKTVRIWSLKDRIEVAKLAHKGACTNFDISPSGKMLVVGGERFIAFWKMENFTEAGIMSVPQWIQDIRYNKDGDKIITAGATHNQNPLHVFEVNPY